MATLRAIFRIARVKSSFLAFLAILLPTYVATGNLARSIERAIPMLFINFCLYIANDLDDMEKDCINHPERPLPQGHLSTSSAAALYFISLAIAFLATSSYIEPQVAWVYYLFTILMVSYRFIVEFLPTTKAFYIAVVVVVPVLIIAPIYPDTPRLYTVAGATFFHFLGREICMNVLDRQGDPPSLFHRLTDKSQAAVAFASMSVSVMLLTTQVQGWRQAVVVGMLAILLAAAGFLWFRRPSAYKQVLSITRIQMLVGIFFLL
jgi:4-hydroxybenzoate polyprenyltransferase